MKRISLLFVALGLFCLPLGLSAQQAYLANAGQSSMTINGTSSLMDWTSTATEVIGEAMLVVKQQELKEVQQLRIRVPVTSIKSSHVQMDEHTWAALQANAHPMIVYEMLKVRSIKATPSGSGYLIETTGTMTIAGQSLPHDMLVEARLQSNGTLIFMGTSNLNMEDYAIDPPTAIFGTITTEPEITIQFSVGFAPLMPGSFMN
ncbi:MAG: YceI family protein [Bacteroidota bacterium]